jgi:hypothetical protein
MNEHATKMSTCEVSKKRDVLRLLNYWLYEYNALLVEESVFILST